LRTEHAAALWANVHAHFDGEHNRVIQIDVDGQAHRVPEAWRRTVTA
jgi:hypothetical protein